MALVCDLAAFDPASVLPTLTTTIGFFLVVSAASRMKSLPFRSPSI